ncbi:MAG: glycosyltransferase family protein [Desulfosarcinaceae bacterium]
MARIVYGVSGEGSGHSSRARVMLNHLLQLGHTVKVVSYDRGYRNLRDDFDVFETEGLHIASDDNRVQKVKTFTENLKRLSKGQQKLNELRHTIFKTFAPDAVITDFEPMTAYLAHHYEIPLISIDNQHRLRYMHYDCPAELKKDQQLTKNIIRAMVPSPDVALVTTFYRGEPANPRTFLFPPILREEVLALQPLVQDHLLVYLTSGFESFIDILKTFTRERFIIYGADREDQEGHLHFKRPSREGFLQYLATCRAVMATAGFTLITEALHLHKPYLALPMTGQFEQEINAHFLSQLGYGINLRSLQPEAVGDFLYRLPELARRLAAYPVEGNDAILDRLTALTEENCSRAGAFRRMRKEG